MVKICSVTLLPPLLSASSLFAQTKTSVGVDHLQGIVSVMENDQMVWKHKAPDSNDPWMLPNGNILFTTGHGAFEMARQSGTILHYGSKSPVFAYQRPKNGNTFVGECVTGWILEISSKGKIAKETYILPKGVKDGGSAFMHSAWRLDNGHFLIVRYGDQCVKEYDANGKVMWRLSVPGGPYSLTCLPNGRTPIVVVDKDQSPRLIEVTSEGKTTQGVSDAGIPGEPLKFLGGFQYSSDECSLIINWTERVSPKEETHLLLIDCQRDVLYSLKSTPELQMISSVYSTDELTGVASYH